MWRKAAACAEAVAQQLPPGRVAFVGCGTSFRPVAGEVDREAYERWKTEIEITA
jgi:hypothetical protein